MTPIRVTKYKDGRSWAVLTNENNLICLTVYKKGAKNIQQILSELLQRTKKMKTKVSNNVTKTDSLTNKEGNNMKTAKVAKVAKVEKTEKTAKVEKVAKTEKTEKTVKVSEPIPNFALPNPLLNVLARKMSTTQSTTERVEMLLHGFYGLSKSKDVSERKALGALFGNGNGDAGTALLGKLAVNWFINNTELLPNVKPLEIPQWNTKTQSIEKTTKKEPKPKAEKAPKTTTTVPTGANLVEMIVNTLENNHRAPAWSMVLKALAVKGITVNDPKWDNPNPIFSKDGKEVYNWKELSVKDAKLNYRNFLKWALDIIKEEQQ